MHVYVQMVTALPAAVRAKQQDRAPPTKRIHLPWYKPALSAMGDFIPMCEVEEDGVLLKLYVGKKVAGEMGISALFERAIDVWVHSVLIQFDAPKLVVNSYVRGQISDTNARLRKNQEDAEERFERYSQSDLCEAVASKKPPAEWDDIMLKPTKADTARSATAAAAAAAAERGHTPRRWKRYSRPSRWQGHHQGRQRQPGQHQQTHGQHPPHATGSFDRWFPYPVHPPAA